MAVIVWPRAASSRSCLRLDGHKGGERPGTRARQTSDFQTSGKHWAAKSRPLFFPPNWSWMNRANGVVGQTLLVASYFRATSSFRGGTENDTVAEYSGGFVPF